MITAEQLEKVRRLRISSHQAATSILAGEYRSVFRGHGIEFSEVREYQCGDDVRSIDWNVTARTGRAHIKRYIEERQISVFILADLSASQHIGSGDGKTGAVVRIAAILAAIAEAGGDRAGLVIFTDRIECFLPPARGPQHLDRLIRELLYCNLKGTGTSIATGLQSLKIMGDQRSIVFIVSDFQDDGFEHDMKLMAMHNDIVAVRLADRVELELPDAGCIRLQDSESGRAVMVDSSQPEVRRLYREKTEKRRSDLATFCRHNRVGLLDLSCDDDYIRELDVFFRKRMATAYFS